MRSVFVLSCRAAAIALALTGAPAAAQEPYKPTVGQAGKDVVWVPTPPELVEKMLDMAKVTPQDVVIDLGSGDGRNIIAAAKRGATAIGVEYNADMVELAARSAKEAGVADKATFVQGDMYEADVSKASVLALFLLGSNLEKLSDKFLAMKPGSRIVLNTFGISGWDPDETEKIEGTCASWCTALLLIVPARVEGKWKLPDGELSLSQNFQMVSGTLGTAAISDGRLRGEEIAFTAGGKQYKGRVNGTTIEAADKSWTATRIGQ